MSRLQLRPPRPADEREFMVAHRALAGEDFRFGLGYEDGTPWLDYLEQLDAWGRGIDLPKGPATSRTDRTWRAPRSARSRRGYATEILGQSLAIAREGGVDRVLVTCDEDNVASAAVIERRGGVFESLVKDTSDGKPKRRYWID